MNKVFLKENEEQLQYAVEDMFLNVYFVYEVGWIIHDDYEIMDFGSKFFSTGIVFGHLETSSHLRKTANFVKNHFGAILNYNSGDNKQEDVLPYIKALMERHNIEKLQYKGGQCEKAIFQKISNLPYEDLEKLGCWRTPESCRAHLCAFHQSKDIVHCALNDCYFYITFLRSIKCNKNVLLE